MKNPNKLFKRYLRLLGITMTPTGIDGLNEIVLKHICHIPFENVSKLLLFREEKRGRPKTLTEFLDGIEFQNLGGTCHSNNPYLYALLNSLGYEVQLLGADMSEQNVHTCLRANLDSYEYHIDVGYAAPFRKPMGLDQIPYQINHGKYSYQFMKNDALNRYEVAVFLDGNKIHGYIVNEDSRELDFFSKTIHDSFEVGRTFMSCIRITRFFKESAVELKNRTLIHYKGGHSHSIVLKNIEALEDAVKNELMMPNCPIRKAVKILGGLTQKSFFEGEYYPEEY